MAHDFLYPTSLVAEMSISNCMRLRKESAELQPVVGCATHPWWTSAKRTTIVTDPEDLVSPIYHSLRDLPSTT
ncbi:hypothetical protein V7S43_010270 [Phytophthora oleae]|uniref:Uncharacterized protein n=1 Tax=Phytophthora oleae TaxID=2107226 RepID=A0ABD3FC65_9STRA